MHHVTVDFDRVGCGLFGFEFQEQQVGVALGPPDANRWDYVVLVRYPSRAVFIEMMGSEDYARANEDRENALDDHVVLAATARYGRFAGEAAMNR